MVGILAATGEDLMAGMTDVPSEVPPNLAVSIIEKIF